ncbi:TDP-N-acetylfucosamine:lipid II N-acetylfucosaminyltransferase [Bordetella genomosp. 7]|uniref:protein O-GlcNAc transferase n=1 Tax=Bordetella genomosp. 7 TaxID=1416805 RepID=A0A261RAW1_9BORD|nr:TDP-N-acetylfucosamine:lipid II N-acetylfucosaminyltransferase [Bordetella genomosp. 7]OZI22129.1 hypothetical protein CAL19_10825 [Bordetella genomosp. 7]
MPRTVRPPRKPSASGKVLTIMGLSEQQAMSRTRNHPGDINAWKSLGAHCVESGRLAQGRTALDRALAMAPRDAEALRVMADLEVKAGALENARARLEAALEIEPGHQLGRIKLAEILHRLGRHDDALQCLDQMGNPDPHRVAWLSWRGVILLAMQRYDDARKDFEAQLQLAPTDYSAWNNLGNVHRDTGNLDEAAHCYGKAASYNQTDPLPRSNRLTAMHYQPDATVEDILQACRDWGAVFMPAVRPERPVPADRTPSRVLRVGMFSDGFRQHPVGTMTVSALEHLAAHGIEIYAYTTNNSVDAITRRFMALARQWAPIYHLDDTQFAARIREDQIDILIDLSGHNAGSRIRAMTMEPAPLLVKWVGGLINTTGVEAIDYLISDRIESPAGSDHLYTEKLIRMPDDYICFVPPPSPPAVGPLPALRNGYITFGCFNNPTKVNRALLARWAELMHAVPHSQLFLKGAAYATAEMRQRVVDTLAGHGIAESRLRIEGRSPHLELLSRYNEVDIALDPWPYSGGLTTCEALLMGVPVVTLPGPTFAGRHSATHLVNAGMPELVARDWAEYQARAVELASDLQSLAAIRTHLRDVLLNSPVCDARRFARHLAVALRAIWCRYCDGKAPAAVVLTDDGRPWFEDEPDARALPGPADTGHGGFSFSFQGKVVTVDHGGGLASSRRISELNRLGTFTFLAIDPAGRVHGADALQREGDLQHHPHIALGDGQDATLYACLDAAFSGTLEPLPKASIFPLARNGSEVLARLPIPTIRLDDVQGLPRAEWLILDSAHDNLKVLAGAHRALATTLVAQVAVDMVALRAGQPHLDDISRALRQHGLRLLRLANMQYQSYLDCPPANTDGVASQLVRADAVYVPDEARMAALTDDERRKLAFILHTCYGATDMASAVLDGARDDAGSRYRATMGWTPPAEQRPHPDPVNAAETGPRRFVHIFYNNMHNQQFISILADPEVNRTFCHDVFVERSASIPGYSNDLSCHPRASFFDHAADLQRIAQAASASDVAAVIFHGMFFAWQKKLVELVSPDKKKVWVAWGGDLYGPIQRQALITDTVRRLDAVATLTQGDYEVFTRHYGPKPHIPFSYASASRFADIRIPVKKDNTIFIGNSGDPTNNHVEIIEALASKQDIEDYDLVIPFSYNAPPGYEPVLIEALKKHGLMARANILRQLIDRAEYLEMLARARLFISAHHRQQAMGNMLASIYFGAGTVLRRRISVGGDIIANPAWERMVNEFSAAPVDFADLPRYCTIAELPALDGAALQAARSRIDALQDMQRFKQNVAATFSAIADL